MHVFQGTNEMLRLYISLTCLQYAGLELIETVKSVSFLGIFIWLGNYVCITYWLTDLRVISVPCWEHQISISVGLLLICVITAWCHFSQVCVNICALSLWSSYLLFNFQLSV